MKITSMAGAGKTISLSLLFSLLLLIVTFDKAEGDLCTSLQKGGTQSQQSGDSTQPLAQCLVTRNVTFNGNGTAITGVGPIVVQGAGVTLTVDHFNYNSSSWAAITAASGGNIVVRNSSSISCSNLGCTALNADTAGSTITVQSSSIPSAAQGQGVQIKNGSKVYLHGVTISGSLYAVLASGSGASVTIDEGSLLEYTTGSGVGVALLNGATGVVHDSTINGFVNGIDVHPDVPPGVPGTVEVLNCLFENNWSALATSYAQNVLFSNSTVLNAVTDGIYFNQSTAVVENSQVIGSLNSGVSFIGCPDGTIQNTLVQNSSHQGVSVVAQDPSSPPSLNIKVLNNTLVNNQIANLLVDDRSTAQIQGNIFTKTPDANIRFHGSQGITLDSALVIDSMSGMEIYGSNSKIVLSDITQNNKNGILVYNNSSLTLEHSLFWNNGLTATAGTGDSYSIFVNLGAAVHAGESVFGPAGKWGLYNLSTASCDVSSNYWDAANGPNAASWVRPPGAINGSGAHLESGYQVSGAVTYIPFLTQTPVSSSINDNVGLASGGGLAWDSQLGLTVGLTANQGSPVLTNEILGVLRVNDTGNLNLVTPPEYLLPGQFYVVWVSAPLRFNSASGFLSFSLPSQNGAVDLKRRQSDGSWTPVSSVWNQITHMLTYSPTDTHLLTGTFAITDIPNNFYAKCDGLCSGKTPCFSSIQSGILSMQTNTVMNATEETFAGSVTYDFPAVLTLSGGWDPTITTIRSDTVIQGTLTIQNGTLILENVVIE